MVSFLLSVLEFAVGVVLAMTTLRDVFGTVVVPGASRASLQVARRLVLLGLPIATRIRGAGRGISTGFAPLILSLTFVIWMVLLMCAFGLMAHALRGSFEPRIESLPQALYIVGSGLVTIGLSQTEAIGAARWLMLVAGFCGLAVMTMAVTYLLGVQGAIARRDAGILKLGTTAGRPPS